MIGVQGTIALGSATDPTAAVPVGRIIQRTPELDATIRRAGFDPDEVNVARTPLVGASRHAEITVLALMQPQSVSGNRAFDYANAQSILTASQDLLYVLVLNEPYAGSTSGGGGGEKPPPPPGPDIDIGEGGVFPGTGPETEEDIAPANPQLTQRLGVATVATTPLQSFQFGRQLRWRNLTITHAQEIVASVAGSGVIATNPAGPSIGGSLFLLKFVDARARFLGQTVWSMADGLVHTGTIRDQWNMIAENPLHLVQQTVKESTYYPPSLTPDSAIPSDYPTPLGSLDKSKMIGIPAPSPWYSETPYTASEIIAAYVSQVAYAPLDRSPISYVYSVVANQREAAGDMLNLDLRGRTVGEALDEIAGRIGCVWFWDRYFSRLTLRPVDQGIVTGPVGGPNLAVWRLYNSAFRMGGGFNEVPNELPGRWATVHPIRFASVWGTLTGQTSEVYADWRSMSSPDGVRTFDLQTSDRPPLYYQINTVGSGRTQFVGDHLPAYYGVQSDEPNTEDWMATTLQVGEYAVWNTEAAGVLSAWWQKPWATGLKDRLQTIAQRYQNAGRIVDGDVVLNRLPAYGVIAPQMNETPCSGLQYDEVRFGMPGMPVMYRLHGKNTDPVLFPHLLKPDRVKAMNLGTAYQSAGCVNLQRINRRGGIVRTFLAQFGRQDVLKSHNGQESVWLYRIREVIPANVLQPNWQPGSDWGQPGVEGYALNLCEIAVSAAQTPQTNFDGGLLNYGGTSGPTITRTHPRGVAPCYEYVAPSGYTVFFLYAPNGVEVECAQPSPAPLNPAWQNSGASGSAFPDFESINRAIEGFT